MFKPGVKTAAALAALALVILLSGAVTRPLTSHQKAFFADPRVSRLCGLAWSSKSPRLRSPRTA